MQGHWELKILMGGVACVFCVGCRQENKHLVEDCEVVLDGDAGVVSAGVDSLVLRPVLPTTSSLSVVAVRSTRFALRVCQPGSVSSRGRTSRLNSSSAARVLRALCSKLLVLPAQGLLMFS